MDFSDQATRFEERERELALKMRFRAGSPAETGYCLNCDAPQPAGRRWCDAACRDEWQNAPHRR